MSSTLFTGVKASLCETCVIDFIIGEPPARGESAFGERYSATNSGQRDELPVRSDVDDPAAVHDHDAVRHLHDRVPMGDQECRLAESQLVQRRVNLVFAFGVDLARRLIEDQDRRRLKERRGRSQSAAAARRKCSCRTRPARSRTPGPGLDELGRKRFLRSRANLVGVARSMTVGDVICADRAQRSRPLRHHGNFLPQLA